MIRTHSAHHRSLELDNHILCKNIASLKYKFAKAKIKNDHLYRIGKRYLRRNYKLQEQIENLKRRAVPEGFQYDFSYLVYEDKDREIMNVSKTFKIVRRQTISITGDARYRSIIENSTYFYYANNLPSSMTINREIIKRCKIGIANFMRNKDGTITIPVAEVDNFKNKIEEVIKEYK
jgi:hypothetical protein